MTKALLLVIIESIAAIFALSSKRVYWAHSFTILNMLFIPIFGGRMISVFGLVSNVGTIFFAFAMLGFALVLLRDGRSNAFTLLERVLVIYAAFFIVAAIVNALPVLPDNEAIAAAMKLVFNRSFNVIVAAFFGLIIGLSVFLFCLDRLQAWSPVLAYALLVPVAQVIDSVIFYPIAFYKSGLDILSLAIDGTLIKIGVALVTIPVVWVYMFSHPRAA